MGKQNGNGTIGAVLVVGGGIGGIQDIMYILWRNLPLLVE